MEFINVLGHLAIIVLTVLGLAKIAESAFSDKQDDDSADEADHTVGEHLDSLDDRVSSLENHVYPAIKGGNAVKEQVDNLAKVQMLILKQLNVEHQILPQRDVLAPLESFADSKKAKERSA